MAIAGGRTLMVYLAADSTKFKRGLADAETSATGFGGSMNRLGASISNMLGPALIGAGLAAGAMATAFAVDGVKAFLEDDAAAQKLSKTLANLGLGEATAGVEAMIDAEQRATGVADDKLRPAFARLAKSVGDVEQATTLMKLAENVATGTGKDLATVADALAKGYDGNTKGLKSLEAGLTAAEIKTGDMAEITAKLSTIYAGQAATAAGTYQGQIDRLSIAANELKESFGRGFVTALLGADNSLNDTADTMKSMEPAVNSLGTSIGDLVTAVGGFFSFLSSHASIGPYNFFDGPVTTLKNALDALREMQGIVSAGGNGPGSGGGGGSGGSFTGTTLNVKSDVSAWGDFYSTLTPFVDVFNKIRTKVDDTGNAVSGTATKVTTLREALTAAATTIDQAYAPALEAGTNKLNDLTAASTAYTQSIAGAITGTLSLSQAWSDAVAANEADAAMSVAGGALTAFQKQIGDATGFATAIGALASDPLVSKELIDQLIAVGQAQGPIAGTALANELISSGMAPELSRQLQALDVFAGQTGATVSGRFYNQGITSAVELLNGLSAEVAAQKQELAQLGKNIGQPISRQIAKEIADAIEAGTRAGRAAAIEANALASAAAFAQVSNSRITPTGASQGLDALTRAADQRTGTIQPQVLG